MTRRAHVAAWLMVWLAGLVAWPFVIGPERMHHLAQAERSALEGSLGLSASRWISAVADRTLRLLDAEGAFASPAAGAVNRTPGAVRGGAHERLVERADRYLAALQLQVHRTVLRLGAFLAWVVLLSPLWLAAVVDGLVQRAVKGATFGYQNPAAFALAGHALIACAMAPGLWLVLPFSLPALVAPCWVAVTLLPLRTVLSHLQPVFTR